MNKKLQSTPFSLVIGAAFATGLAASPVVLADVNPFAVTVLSSGYMVADSKTGEGQYGASKSISEAKCEAEKAAQKIANEGECGAKNSVQSKPVKEAKCGEAKCGGKK